MSRTIVLRTTQVAIDVVALSLSLWLAFLFRFEGRIPDEMLRRLLIQWPYVVGLQYGLLVMLGISRIAWRYIGLREAVRIFAAVSIGSLLLTAVRLIAADLFRVEGLAEYSYLPLGVIAIDFALAYLTISGVRVMRRLTSEHAEMRQLRAGGTTLVPTLLVGAGRGGVMVAKEISGRPELGILPVGFIDDDPTKVGTDVHGVRVCGPVADVARIARQRGAKQAIITISNAPGAMVRSISAACQRADLQVKLIPGLYQIVGGELNLTRMRNVAIEDLLRRDPVVLDDAAIASDLRGRVVMVTGAGGSIGSEICRQVARFGPRRLVLVERTENALFEIHRELSESHKDLNIAPCIADIGDRARVEAVFDETSPEVVFHAAAHKHVPMMECNPGEAVKNNVFGTRLLVDTAHARGVRAFVMISTDKAVNPTSVMGATKRVAEIYVQSLAKGSQTRFVTVRFGNVLGSNGSVVPIFKEQIARGGPVTVTHPDMRRYFMTIPEACQLVLQAGSMGRGGEIFILDMGEPVKIVDLARDLIQLSGFSEDEIEIVFSGVRPGEKLYEELSGAAENADKTRHPKVFIGRTTAESYASAVFKLDRLQQVLATGDGALLRAALADIVPEYRAPDAPRAVLESDVHDLLGQRTARQPQVPGALRTAN